MYKIYKITNKKHPSEIYIGSTKQTLRERLAGHSRNKHSSVYSYIQRDGKENFEIVAIDYANNKKEAIEKETFWTLFFKEQGYFLYNRKAGDEPFEKVKQKMSKKAKERLKDPTKNSMYGKHHTGETKNKISKSRKGKLLNSNHPRARKIRCIDDNKIFNCIKDAANFYNTSSHAIINNCRKKSKSCAGHHFEYV